VLSKVREVNVPDVDGQPACGQRTRDRDRMPEVGPLGDGEGPATIMIAAIGGSLKFRIL